MKGGTFEPLFRARAAGSGIPVMAVLLPNGRSISTARILAPSP